MTKQSTHKRWKGHCQLCGRYRCNGNKGVSWRMMRSLGKKRRLTNKRGDEE